MNKSILSYFETIKDPRIDRRKLYPLEEILFVALCSITAGGEGFDDMALYGRETIDTLLNEYPFKNGIPSEDTFRRVFSLIDPIKFRDCFAVWVNSLSIEEKKLVAIDGKASRRTHSQSQTALHLVSAYAVEEGLVLAQVAVPDKANEITAIKELVKLTDLQNTVVTIDAMGCQKEIAGLILEAGGDYILSLKDNHPTLRSDVEAVFEGKKPIPQSDEQAPIGLNQSNNKDHGRIESRICRSMDLTNVPIPVSEWPKIKSIIEIKSSRTIKGVSSSETRYYISSLPSNAQDFNRYIRGHWGIENGLHYVLDVVFKEDASRIRTKNAPANMAIMRHTALNLLKKDKTKGSIRGKMKKAGWNAEYMLQIVTGSSV